MSFSSNIKALQELVSFLPDRDAQLKKDAELFKRFFTNFPIPVTMWSLDSSKKLLSKRGNTVIKEQCSSCDDMFLEKYSNEFKQKHDEAYSGNEVSFFSFLEDDKTYYTKIIPWKNGDKVTGVTGISWDISSNFKILSSLKKIVELSDNNPEVKKIASEAIKMSKIKLEDSANE